MTVHTFFGVTHFSLDRFALRSLRTSPGFTGLSILILTLGVGVTVTIATLTAAGAAIGVAGSVAATRFLSSLLYGVAPLDWVTFGGVVGAIGLVALIASAAPAMRAARVDPLVALRYE